MFILMILFFLNFLIEVLIVSIRSYPEGTLPTIKEDCLVDFVKDLILTIIFGLSKKEESGDEITFLVNQKIGSLHTNDGSVGGRFEIVLKKNDKDVIIIEAKKFDFAQGKLLDFFS
jgi:hypothetical protein